MKRNPTFYRRNLPHWHPPGAAIFVTWRLKGSLPDSAVKRLRETHRLLKREAERRNLPIEDLNLRINKKLFAMMDEVLDRAENGPTWLKQPAIADMMQDALLNSFWQTESFDHWPRDEDEFYRIIAYIENNPVKAGLVKVAEDWPWSSAAERKRRGWREIRSLT